MPRRFNALVRARTAAAEMRRTLGNQSRWGLLTATLSGAVLLVPDPALADDSTKVEVVALNSPLIVVSSYDEEYIALEEGTPIKGTIKVELDTGAVGRIKRWIAWPSFGYQDDSAGKTEIRWGTYPGAEVSQNYGSPGRKEVNTSFQFSAEPGDYAAVMVAACNSYADKLSSQGMGDTEIFSSNRWIQVAVRAFVEVEATGPEGNPITELKGWPNYKKVNVICEGSLEMDVPQGPLTAANLSATVAQTVSTGACTLELSGSITSREPYEDVEFRYVDGNGKQSDLETVTTNADGTIAFTHSYPVSANTESGKVRMVGASPLFLSNWSNFEVDCVEAVDDLQTLLPPEVVHLDVSATAKKGVYRGHVCPAEVLVTGVFKGRGSTSGTAILTVNGIMREQRGFNIDDKESRSVGYLQSLSWAGIDGPLQQDIHVALVLQNANREPVDSLAKTQTVRCVEADKPDQFTSNDPTPPMLTLGVRSGEEGLHKGYFCPERIALTSRVLGQEDFDGRVTFVVRQNESLVMTQSQVKEFNFSITEDENLTFDFEPDVRWSNVIAPDGVPPKQVLDISVQIVRHGSIHASVDRALEVSCKGASLPDIGSANLPEPDAGGPATSALSTGEPLASQVQQGGKAAAAGQIALQAGPAFAIQAPKGRVQAGRIQLSGGAANAKYDLRFYRGDKGGYRMLRSAQLPRQMTGRTATFNLKALSGSRFWRIEVCPAGSKNKEACKTSAFQLPSQRSSSKGAPRADAAGAKVFILPGQGG